MQGVLLSSDPLFIESESYLVFWLRPWWNIWTSIYFWRLWCEYLLNKSLNLTQALNKDSVSNYANDVISCHNLVVLPSKKYWAKKASTSYSYVIMDAQGSDSSHCLALPFIENGNNLNLIALSNMASIFNISHTSKNPSMWLLGSSFGKPWNCTDYWTICTKKGLQLKIVCSY